MTLYNTSPRVVSLQLLALNNDGSTLLDLSGYLSDAQTTHSDQPESHKGTFILNNTGGIFDPLGGGTYDTVLAQGRIFKYTITINSTAYTRYYGTIQEVDFNYARGEGQFAKVSCLDLAYKLLTATVTSNEFNNQQLNLIASDLILQYGGYINTDLATLDLIVPTFQAPSLSVLDCLTDLFGIPNYFFWFNYAGVFSSSPRVGTGIVGIPDALVAPVANIVLPDNALIHSSQPTIKSYNTINQVVVIGESLDASITYGPIQLLTQVGSPDQLNFLSPGDGHAYTIPISQQTGSSNAQMAGGVYVKLLCTSYSFQGLATSQYGGNGYRYLCADPTAISAETGEAVPLGPFDGVPGTNYEGNKSAELLPQNDSQSHPHIQIWKSDGREEGDAFLNVLCNNGYNGVTTPGQTLWTSVPMFFDANQNGGGFLYCIQVWGKPVVLQDLSLTVFLDYNPTYLTNCTMVDVFGDHKTYQVLDPANPSTTLSENVSAGATSFTVTSATGFNISGSIYIGTGSNFETATITNIVGNTFTISSPLVNNYSIGNSVTGTTTIQPLAKGTPVEILVNAATIPLPTTTLSEPAVAVPPLTLSTSSIQTPQTITVTSSANFVVPSVSPLTIENMNIIRIGSNVNATNNLSANVSSGANHITLNSATGFYDNAQISIGSGINYETVTISNISSNTLTLASNLVNSHLEGEAVIIIPVYEYANVTGVSGNVITLGNPLTNNYAAGVPVVGLTAAITADGLLISDLVRVDFEQGRIVFDDLVYNNFLEDSENLGNTGTDNTNADNTPFGQSTFAGNVSNLIGAEAQSGNIFEESSLSFLGVENPAPAVVYTTVRTANAPGDEIGFTYTITGLQAGRGYTLRLHYMEYYFTTSGQRLFDVYLNGEALENNFDIFANAGAIYQVYISEYQGVNAQVNGEMVLQFVNFGSGVASPIVSAVEIIDPQGVGGALPEINCGGPALNPTPPIIQINGAYSENQRQFGIKKQEIDNPLLSTIAMCTTSGQYALNRAAWSNYPVKIITAAFPTITPAMIVQYFNPFCGPNGADQWMYIESVDHRASRSDQECIATDEYTGYLLYSSPR